MNVENRQVLKGRQNRSYRV